MTVAPRRRGGLFDREAVRLLGDAFPGRAEAAVGTDLALRDPPEPGADSRWQKEPRGATAPTGLGGAARTAGPATRRALCSAAQATAAYDRGVVAGAGHYATASSGEPSIAPDKRSARKYSRRARSSAAANLPRSRRFSSRRRAASPSTLATSKARGAFRPS